ncbi:MAG: hypothetical protein ACRC67_39445 [Inquilinus sp.]
MALQHLGLDMHARPQRRQQLIGSDQPAGILGQVAKDIERLRRQRDALILAAGMTAPETEILPVDPER